MHASAARNPSASLWPAFAMGLAVAAGNGLARFAYALLLPAMREDLHWSYAQAGWLNTANALGYVAGAVSGLLLLRRASPAQLFIWGLWLTIVSLLATGWIGRLEWLTACRVAAGVGAAWVFSCGSALVSLRYRDDLVRRGTAIGLFFSGAGLGIVLSALTVGPLLASQGAGAWPHAWLMLGVLAMLLCLAPLRLAARLEADAGQLAAPPLQLAGHWMTLVGYFAFAVGYVIYMTFIVAWMQHRGWDWSESMVLWLILGLAVAMSPFVWRRALEYWPPALVLSASCTACLVGTALSHGAGGLAGQLASAAVFGLGVLIAPSALAVLVRTTMQPSQWAKGMTIYTVVFAVGQAIGPLAAGWLADASTLGASLWFGEGALAASVLLVLAGWQANRCRPHRLPDVPAGK